GPSVGARPGATVTDTTTMTVVRRAAGSIAESHSWPLRNRRAAIPAFTHAVIKFGRLYQLRLDCALLAQLAHSTHYVESGNWWRCRLAGYQITGRTLHPPFSGHPSSDLSRLGGRISPARHVHRIGPRLFDGEAGRLVERAPDHAPLQARGIGAHPAVGNTIAV